MRDVQITNVSSFSFNGNECDQNESNGRNIGRLQKAKYLTWEGEVGGFEYCGGSRHFSDAARLCTRPPPPCRTAPIIPRIARPGTLLI